MVFRTACIVWACPRPAVDPWAEGDPAPTLCERHADLSDPVAPTGSDEALAWLTVAEGLTLAEVQALT